MSRYELEIFANVYAESYCLRISPDGSVGDIRRAVAAELGMYADAFSLSYCGAPLLEDDALLCDVSIGHAAEVCVAAREDLLAAHDSAAPAAGSASVPAGSAEAAPAAAAVAVTPAHKEESGGERKESTQAAVAKIGNALNDLRV